MSKGWSSRQVGWREEWTTEPDEDGVWLLVVRESRPLQFWWRVRRGKKNLAKGYGRSFRHARHMALKAKRGLAAGAPYCAEADQAAMC